MQFFGKNSLLHPLLELDPPLLTSGIISSSVLRAGYLFRNIQKCLPYLRPVNKVCEGYVFSGVCLSTGGGVCPIAYWDTNPLGRYTPWQTPPGRHPPGQTPPVQCSAVHAGIRSTSRQYASHWNAFLFLCTFRTEQAGKAFMRSTLQPYYPISQVFLFLKYKQPIRCAIWLVDHMLFSILAFDKMISRQRKHSIF